MPSVGETKPGKEYWRSLDDLADTPEFRKFVEAEFPELALALLTGPTRRQFLKLMGASLALAGVAGCRWPEEKIAPYARRPANRTPGVPVHYSTATEFSGRVQGLLVTSYDGRPVKIEGNPQHPINRGTTDAFAQAAVLELYDPDRSHFVTQRSGYNTINTDWAAFAAFAGPHFAELRARAGAGLAVLSESSSSPSCADMRGRFRKAFPQAGWYEYEPISRDNEREGARLGFGRPVRTTLALDQADVIASLDDDLFLGHPVALRHMGDFATGRRVGPDGRREDTGGPMNRLFVVESDYSITGGMADHRMAVRSSDVAAVACRLATALVRQGLELPAPLSGLAEAVRGAAAVGDAAVIEAMAGDLLANRGRSVIAAGPRQPAEVHALVHVLNEALGNVGPTVRYLVEPDADRPTHSAAITVLAEAMQAGQVETLIVLGGNPVLNAPADLEFGERLDSVKTRIHLGLYADETARACTWHLPRAHDLESWGDVQGHDGTLTVMQPLIAPLYDGRTPTELLAVLAGEEVTKGFDIVRRTLQGRHRGGDFETAWQQVLHDGVLEDSAWPMADPALQGGEWVAGLAARATVKAGGLEVVFRADAKVFDGRFANNGWLQELPEPMTKLTWDNAALLGPATAEELGVQRGDVLKIEHEGRALEIAAFVLPGHAAGSITIPLGYGRTATAGTVAEGVGFNAYPLRTTKTMDVAEGVKVSRTGRHYTLATTQDHHAMESQVGRREMAERVPNRIVREADVEEYVHHPEFARHAPGGHAAEPAALWQEPAFEGKPRWAMSIDLNVCTGCSACVVACQAENNIPIVGKDEVTRGREMQWIRIDRSFKGEPTDAQVSHQPMPCQQCENAPCEQVCPVAATVHSAEGLNDMVYNRCIGTRYCSNNCPYKVRRFNWFNNYRDRDGLGLKGTGLLVLNPEVTVRSRGVMEKCTYCVQRINVVKIAAKNEGRPIADGEITPACAQACPTQAIVFGDLNDPNSRVSRLHHADRTYVVLDELNVKPRTKYMAKIRNPKA